MGSRKSVDGIESGRPKPLRANLLGRKKPRSRKSVSLVGSGGLSLSGDKGAWAGKQSDLILKSLEGKSKAVPSSPLAMNLSCEKQKRKRRGQMAYIGICPLAAKRSGI